MITRFKTNYTEEPNSGCWLWHGYSPNGRYGSMKLRGLRRLAHVLSYEIHRGPVPAGCVVDHLCRVTFCVNPQHLEAVPQLINVRRGAPATRETCIHGHLYAAGVETYIRPDGKKRYRRCLTCYRLRYPNTAKIGAAQ